MDDSPVNSPGLKSVKSLKSNDKAELAYFKKRCADMQEVIQMWEMDNV
jgi:hypothetical protein